MNDLLHERNSPRHPSEVLYSGSRSMDGRLGHYSDPNKIARLAWPGMKVLSLGDMSVRGSYSPPWRIMTIAQVLPTHMALFHYACQIRTYGIWKVEIQETSKFQLDIWCLMLARDSVDDQSKADE